MYNLPPKIVLVSATSGVSDVYFLDSSIPKETYTKQLDSKILNASLPVIERYFPQKSQVVLFTNKEDRNDYLSTLKLGKEYKIDLPNEDASDELLRKFESDDILYLDLNFEKIKIYHLYRSEKTKKIVIKVFEEDYKERLLALIQSSDEALLKNVFFSESLDEFNNSKEYSISFKKSSYIISCLLKNILSGINIEKDLDIKSFGKSHKSNPILVVGGDAVKFFGMDSIILSLSQAIQNILGFEIYRDYSHMLLAFVSLQDNEKDVFFMALFEKYLESAYHGKYINLMNNSDLQKIYAMVKVKDGLAEKDLFGISGT
ncbi:MAG: hypothetical protein WCO33_03085, partial [bacterium]